MNYLSPTFVGFFVYRMMGRFGYEFHRIDLKNNNYIE